MDPWRARHELYLFDLYKSIEKTRIYFYNFERAFVCECVCECVCVCLCLCVLERDSGIWCLCSVYFLSYSVIECVVWERERVILCILCYGVIDCVYVWEKEREREKVRLFVSVRVLSLRVWVTVITNSNTEYKSLILHVGWLLKRSHKN